MEAFLNILSSIPSYVADNALIVSAVALLYEVIGRFIKSTKVQSIPRMLVKLMHGLSYALEAIAKAGDKIIPDKK